MAEKSQKKSEDDRVDDHSSFSGPSNGADDMSMSGHLTISTSNDTDEAENRYFGRSENRNVRNFKGLVFLVLFLVTLAVCVVIFYLTRQGQQHEFEAS
jgi:hypothetical protein